MSVVLPTSEDWDTVNKSDGLLLIGGRLAELLHPELWDGCTVAFSHALDQHPWDYSGGGNTGTREGGLADGPDAWDFGTIAQARKIVLPGSVAYGDSYATLSAWIRPATVTGNHLLFGEADNEFDYHSYFDATNIYYNTGVFAERQTWARGFTANVWSAFSLVRHGDTNDNARYWEDGVDQGAGAQSGSSWSGQPSMFDQIGTESDGSDTLKSDGLMTSIMGHNRALTDSEILLLHTRMNAAYECRILPRVFSADAPVGGATPRLTLLGVG